MEDFNCPYCGEGKSNDSSEWIDGDGSEHEVQCSSCDEYFTVVASISINYEPYCLDEKHKYVSDEVRHPNAHNDGRVWANCENCDFFGLIDPSKIK